MLAAECKQGSTTMKVPKFLRRRTTRCCFRMQFIDQVLIHSNQRLGEDSRVVNQHVHCTLEGFELRSDSLKSVHLYPKSVHDISHGDGFDHQLDCNEPSWSLEGDQFRRKCTKAVLPNLAVHQLDMSMRYWWSSSNGVSQSVRNGCEIVLGFFFCRFGIFFLDFLAGTICLVLATVWNLNLSFCMVFATFGHVHLPFCMGFTTCGMFTFHFEWYLPHFGMFTFHFAWDFLRVGMFTFHFVWYLPHFGMFTFHFAWDVLHVSMFTQIFTDAEAWD